MAKRRIHAVNREGSNISLYLVMNDIFKVKKNNNLFKINTNYKVIGWGYGSKISMSAVRKEFWSIINLHNDNAKTITIWKTDLNKLWDGELIIMVK